jgi:hypothetical protein
MGGWWGFVRIVVCVVALVVPLVANARRLHHEVAGGAPFDPWDGRGRLTEVIRDTAVVQSQGEVVQRWSAPAGEVYKTLSALAAQLKKDGKTRI